MGENEKKGLLKEKKIWISCLIGIALGMIILFTISMLFDFSITRKVKKIKSNAKVLLHGIKNDTVAVLEDESISQTELYNDMKKYYDIDAFIDFIDSRILNKKYTLTEEQQKEVKDQAEEIIEQYSLYYGQTEADFLESHRFESKDDFITYLELDYKRNLYYLDYLRTVISKKEIEDYYNSGKIYGEISTEFIFINSSEENSEDADQTAHEILAKLDEGAAFDDVAKEYEETAYVQELNFNSFNEKTIIQSYPEEYIEASKNLEKGTYIKVNTEYGYFIIYCIDKKDIPTLEDAEEDILLELSEDIESKDQNIRYKTLITLRENANLKITDETLENRYKEYCQQYEN